MKKKINIGIIGISGKMGTALSNLISKDKSLYLIGGVRKKSTIENSTFSKNIQKLAKEADVLIDFSSSSILNKLLQVAEKYKTPLIIGTTGYNKKDFLNIKKFSKKIPILYSSNFSLGMQICKKLLKIATEKALKFFKIKIEESHHKTKKDSPSGTALCLEKIIFDLLKKKTPISSKREDQIIGEHNITFSNPYEEFEIKHKAKSRLAFASYVLLSAKFIYKKPANLYRLEDIFYAQKI